jgi:hypothetical protein
MIHAAQRLDRPGAPLRRRGSVRYKTRGGGGCPAHRGAKGTNPRDCRLPGLLSGFDPVFR